MTNAKLERSRYDGAASMYVVTVPRRQILQTLLLKISLLGEISALPECLTALKCSQMISLDYDPEWSSIFPFSGDMNFHSLIIVSTHFHTVWNGSRWLQTIPALKQSRIIAVLV